MRRVCIKKIGLRAYNQWCYQVLTHRVASQWKSCQDEQQKMCSTITEDSPERQGLVERLQLSISSERDEVGIEYRDPAYSLNLIRL